MSYETIRYTVEDGVATITLHRPEKLNAFTHKMMEEVIVAFDAIDADDAVRAVIVTGEGRAFCAGADLSEGANAFKTENEAIRSDGSLNYAVDDARDGGGRVTLRIFQCLKPVIAAINGPAVGIGATMTLPMDIRLASDTARMGFVFARRGIVNEAASAYFLPRVVGVSQALEWCMTGRVFDAKEAHAGGLVRSDPCARGSAASRARTGKGDCRQYRAGLRRPDPSDGLARPGHDAPHGGAQSR